MMVHSLISQHCSTSYEPGNDYYLYRLQNKSNSTADDIQVEANLQEQLSDNLQF